jgi:hypothetical protein
MNSQDICMSGEKSDQCELYVGYLDRPNFLKSGRADLFRNGLLKSVKF